VAQVLEQDLDRHPVDAAAVAAAMNGDEIEGVLAHHRRASLVGIAGVVRGYGQRRLSEQTTRDFNVIKAKVRVLPAPEGKSMPDRGSRPSHRATVDEPPDGPGAEELR
jgi:hypothetical protein